ncbi:hypothetical protein C1646_762559 [Rhizophagus diaphanus]|nr:hypothetical protein C1646_762559 [Rhizophagus diaphanus] [Rhizophagus sp. MUCL 43196]
MIERSYKDGKFKVGRCSFHIYCTVYDSLVIICENIIKYDNDHLKKCIAKIAKRHIAYSNLIQKNMKKGVSSKLSDDEIEKIYQTFDFIFSKYWAKFSYAYEFKIRKKYVNHLIDSAKVVQQVWRDFKLKSDTWAKQV